MRPERTTLVMGGAREAHGLITALVARRRQVIASLPEPERMFDAFPVPTRVGAFDTKDAFSDWAQAHHVSTVIDASHAFDDHICEMVSSFCTRHALRYLRLLRPPWRQTVRDRWRPVATVRQAALSIPQGARAFTNTGWLTLPDYADFKGQRLFMRQTHAPSAAPPYAFVEFVEGHPPFSQFQEQALFTELGITHLICRNVGGAASMSKLLAARALEIPVLMIARKPPQVPHAVVDTVAEALAWEANA